MKNSFVLCVITYVPRTNWGSLMAQLFLGPGECVLSVVHLINLTPIPVLHGKSPYECLFGVAPSYAHVRVFSWLCYVAHMSHLKDKFDSKSRNCIFVDYPHGKKGWRLYDLESHDFFF